MRTITINGFDPASVQSAINELRMLRAEVDRKTQDICMKVAEFGARWAAGEFRSAEYPSGANDVSVVAEPTGTGARVHASGETVLFIEYGAGALRGYGHPRPEGYGPGTFNPNYPTPENPNWSNPSGWYYAHGKKTMGNPPAAAMYHAEQAMQDYAQQIADGELK